MEEREGGREGGVSRSEAGGGTPTTEPSRGQPLPNRGLSEPSTTPGTRLVPGMSPVALLEAATNAKNVPNKCGSQLCLDADRAWHCSEPPTQGTPSSPPSAPSVPSYRCKDTGYKARTRAARPALSPELTLNQRPGPLPRGRLGVTTGEEEASAAGSTCPRQWWRGGGQATPLPLPHLGMLKPPRLHARLPDGLNLGSEIRNSCDSAEH